MKNGSAAGSDERAAVEHKAPGKGGFDLAGERALQLRDGADGAEEHVQVVHAVVGRRIEGIEPRDIVAGKRGQRGVHLVKAVGRLAGGAAEAEHPVDLAEADKAPEVGCDRMVFSQILSE